jgi:hypothetical protein
MDARTQLMDLMHVIDEGPVGHGWLELRDRFGDRFDPLTLELMCLSYHFGCATMLMSVGSKNKGRENGAAQPQ